VVVMDIGGGGGGGGGSGSGGGSSGIVEIFSILFTLSCFCHM